jgi:SNF2 family DNA or RNA helicase
MQRTIGKIESLEEKIRQFQRLQKSDGGIDLNELGFDADDEEVQDVLEVGSRIKYRLEHLRLGEWLEDLKQDKDQLRIPYFAAQDMTVERDAKFQELKRLIAAKVRNPTVNKLGEPNRKVLVFTAFADTVTYLYDNLKEWALKDLGVNIAMVSGGSVENRTTFGRNLFNHIIINFSPRSKQRARMRDMPQQGEIDILIATDCISEGQNLQDCDYLVNYDIHWNPVRIIQRFGRIDRIGSVNRSVQLVNFWPTEDLNKYINLKNRVEARMALVDIAATFEDNILSNEDLRELVSSDLKYRDKQLLRLQKEILDLEDFSESITLNEFTLDDFRMELVAYIEANRKALEEAPFGLYALVPPPPDHPIIKPGVIFCLKHKAASGEGRSRDVNPLQPYFLVYVRENKEVRYTFAQPKQILDIFRQLCRDRTAACDDLCELFDAQTGNGSDMKVYTELLSAAVDSIKRTFQKRIAEGLKQGRDFVIPDQTEQARDASDFELVTWLVIKQA